MLSCCRVEITYDTSSPSQLARFLSGLSSFDASKTKLCYKTINVDKELWADNGLSLPFVSSTISKYLAMGDVIKRTMRGELIVRDLGYLILENNNVEAIIGVIDAAHKILNSGLSRVQLDQVFPYHLLDAQDAIEKVLTQQTVKKAKEVLMSPVTQAHLSNAYNNVKCIG